MVLLFRFYCHGSVLREPSSAMSGYQITTQGCSSLLLGAFGLCSFGPFLRSLPLHCHCLLGSFSASPIGRDLSTHVTAGSQLHELLSGSPALLSSLTLVLRPALPLQTLHSLLTRSSVLFNIGYDEQARELQLTSHWCCAGEMQCRGHVLLPST